MRDDFLGGCCSSFCFFVCLLEDRLKKTGPAKLKENSHHVKTIKIKSPNRENKNMKKKEGK